MTDASTGGRAARGGAPSQSFDSLYFCLGYAPTVRTGSGDGSSVGPDESVVAFFHDLSDRVRLVLGAAPGIQVGYLPMPEPGEPWPGRATALALARCKILVPLYCERYFNNARCGQQWSVFWQRATARGANARHTVVPALWRAAQSDPLPEPAAKLGFDHTAFGHSYAVYGLASIMKLNRYREDYQIAVDQIARRIVQAAHVTDLPPAEPLDPATAPNAFGDRPSSRRLHVAVIAPTLVDLPAGRDAAYYGASALDWNPYRPGPAASLSDHVDNVVRNLDYQPDTKTFEEARKDLLADGAPTGPGLLIVDAWALLDARRRSLLARFDMLVKPWVGVLVPWNPFDEQTMRAEEQLRAVLNTALGRKLAEGRIASRAAVQGIPSLDVFDQALAEVLESVKRQYLRNARAFPPVGAGTGRPHLSIPATPRTDGQPDQGGPA
jgi:FxsC-like protein